MTMLVPTDKITKESTIYSMLKWPLVDVAPENEKQEQALKEANKNFRGLALWLGYRLMGRSDLHGYVFNDYYIQFKPRADLAVAGWNFCFQVFARYQGDYESAEHLWGRCEYSFGKNAFRSTGYFGDKVIGKNECYEANKKGLNNFADFAEGNEVTRITGYDSSEHLYEQLLDFAFRYANEHNDKDLQHHAEQFLKSLRHFNDISRRDNRKIIKVLPGRKKRDRRKKHQKEAKGFVTKC